MPIETAVIEASRQAAIALARVDSHVIECTGRYHEFREGFADLRESIRRLHERVDTNSEARQIQFDRVRRDNKNVYIALLIGSGGWVVTIAMHFWK